jgi:hypothetical protein
MDTNVKCIEPNLAIFFRDQELKHYNLVWGGWQRTKDTPSYVSFITNMLLVKTSTGEFIPPAYPTTVEMQTQVESLDYDGEYFWSVQSMNSTPNYPGWIISKWQVSEELYGLDRVQFRTFPGFVKANCMTAERYNFTLRDGTDSTRDYITVSTAYDYILQRIQPGFKIKIGPNNPGEIFWGTVKEVYPYPNNPYYSPYWWVVRFEENLNSSYVAGEDAFVNAGLYVFDSGGTLNVLHPETLSVMETHEQGDYLNVTGCAFSVVKNIPNINVGMRTPALFYTRDMVIYCKRVSDLSHTVAAQILPQQYHKQANSFFTVHELRIRNDHPEDINNHPQHYLLQNEYREDRNVDGDNSSWSTYNYVLKKLESEVASMIVDVQPQFLTRSGIAECSCRMLDTYNFPVPGVQITWSHNCGSKAYFMDAAVSGTDANGYVHNRLYITQDLTFPAYVTASTDAL